MTLPGGAGRRVVNRWWAWAALITIPVWVVLAAGLISADLRAPAVVTVAPGVSSVELSSTFRQSVVKDLSLYLAPGSAVDGATCVFPRDVGDVPIRATAPDRSGTATRTVDGVTYTHYGRVYSMTRAISCTPGVTGLLLTEYDGDHQKRYFAVALLIACPIIGLIAVRILRRRPR